MAARNEWVKARLSKDERAALDEVKQIYGTDSDSEIIRLMVQYVLNKKPTLTQVLRPIVKTLAAIPKMA